MDELTQEIEKPQNTGIEGFGVTWRACKDCSSRIKMEKYKTRCRECFIKYAQTDEFKRIKDTKNRMMGQELYKLRRIVRTGTTTTRIPIPFSRTSVPRAGPS